MARGVAYPRPKSMVGHSGGEFIEDVLQRELASLKPQATNEFLSARLSSIFARQGSKAAALEVLNHQWWWVLNSRSKAAVGVALSGSGKLEKYQQDTADLIIEFGGIPRLINTKSHDLGRDGRDPNIISVMKLLKFFSWAARLPSDERARTLEEFDVYFVGASWEATGESLRIKQLHLRQLTKLNVEQIPQVNFDAANQIQWHIGDMEELPSQTAREFANALAERVVDDYESHTAARAAKLKAWRMDIAKL
ncbi:MAG: HincII family type II restriction endonuclease [Thermoplasmatota archaeon]